MRYVRYRKAPRGERHYKAKLNNKRVKLIRQLFIDRQVVVRKMFALNREIETAKNLIRENKDKILQLKEEYRYLSPKKIGDRMGVGRDAVVSVINGLNWRHVK